MFWHDDIYTKRWKRIRQILNFAIEKKEFTYTELSKKIPDVNTHMLHDLTNPMRFKFLKRCKYGVWRFCGRIVKNGD